MDTVGSYRRAARATVAVRYQKEQLHPPSVTALPHSSILVIPSFSLYAQSVLPASIAIPFCTVYIHIDSIYHSVLR